MPRGGSHKCHRWCSFDRSRVGHQPVRSTTRLLGFRMSLLYFVNCRDDALAPKRIATNGSFRREDVPFFMCRRGLIILSSFIGFSWLSSGKSETTISSSRRSPRRPPIILHTMLITRALRTLPSSSNVRVNTVYALPLHHSTCSRDRYNRLRPVSQYRCRLEYLLAIPRILFLTFMQRLISENGWVESTRSTNIPTRSPFPEANTWRNVSVRASWTQMAN